MDNLKIGRRIRLSMEKRGDVWILRLQAEGDNGLLPVIHRQDARATLCQSSYGPSGLEG